MQSLYVAPKTKKKWKKDATREHLFILLRSLYCSWQ